MLNIEKINTRFHTMGAFIVRFRWVNLIFFAVLVGTACLGIRQIEPDVDTKNWFLEDDALLAARERFEKIFGNDDFCAVLVEADDVFTHPVLSRIRELGRELLEKVPYADEVVSLTDFEFTLGTEAGLEIINLVPDPVPTSPDALQKIKRMAVAKPAMKNRIVSEDGRYTWLVLRMKPIPDDWQQELSENPDFAVGRIFNAVVGQEKYKILHPKTTGLPIINVEKMSFFAKETPRTFGIGLLVTIGLLIIFLRSVRGVIFPLLTVISAISIILGFEGFLGIRFDPSMLFLPLALVLAISIGYSIHLFNFFTREFLKTGNRHQAAIHAVQETGWPLLFSALTTIAALLSFLFVPLRVLRWVGLTSACLVGLTYILVLVLLPSLLSFGKDRKPNADYIKNGGRLLERLMGGMGRRVLARPKLTYAIVILIVVSCFVGISRFDVSFDLRRSMGLDVPYVNRLHAIGQTPVGSLYSYDVAIEFDQPDAIKDPENLRKFQQLIEEVKSFQLTKKTSSLLDIIKDMNQVVNNGDPAYYRIPETREMIAQLLLLYENAGGVEVEKWVDYDYQRLRLAVEVDDYNSGEASRELRQIQQRGKALFPTAKILLIGSISQYTVMQDYVTWGQVRSFFISLGVITALMIVVLGSIRVGLIAMIPNISPALVVGGIMGFANIPLDMITVTLMPMLLGLAVDDTIHFINHCQLEYERCGSYRESIRRTFTAVGVALVMTTTVLVLNFSACLTSVVKVYENLGILIPAGILAALAADFFVTPVLLDGFRPFEKRFMEKPKR
ncbi:MAG: hypothetical protein CSA22_06770 [Deltaproteobacteria bacterium]|nr:MAG: hypothetical protein CSA22_06770 [Deltaproteobacteria bacterium]